MNPIKMSAQAAIFDAKPEIDDKAGRHPSDELDPIDEREHQHLTDTSEHAQDGDIGGAGNFKQTLDLWVGVAKNENGEADDCEDQKSGHGAKFTEDIEGKESANYQHNQGGDDRGKERGMGTLVDFAEDIRD